MSNIVTQIQVPAFTITVTAIVPCFLFFRTLLAAGLADDEKNYTEEEDWDDDHEDECRVYVSAFIDVGRGDCFFSAKK